MSKKRPRLGVAVIVQHQDKLLIGKRAKDPNRGKWVVPGGGVKWRETIPETANREIREETGLNVEIFWPQRPHILEIHGEDEHRVILVFRGLLMDGTKIESNSDLSEVCWCAKHELATLEISPAVVPVLAAHGWL